MLASLLAGFASGQTATIVNRTKRAAIAYLLAAIAAACGIGFLMAAFYIWLANRYGAIEAALGIGCAFLALAVLIVIVHRVIATIQARREAARKKADLAAMGVATGLAILPSLLRSKAGLGALLVPVVGLAAYLIYQENSSGTDPEE